MSLKVEEWVHDHSNSKSKPSGNCIIHCTNASDNLVSLQSFDSWKISLKAVTIRQHEAVLIVASALPEGVIPDIKYPQRRRSIFTIKKLLNIIKENEKVNFP